MKKILVTYATNSGTTAEVAQKIGEEIQATGAQVEVLSLEKISSPAGYDAVVLGGPMIMGWHGAALGFLKKHQAILAKIPVALFVTCISLTRTGETQVEGIPVMVDPTLPRPPAREGHLSFKERYATLGNYLRPMLKAAPQVKPVRVAFFGGRLDMYRLKWWQALFVILVIQASPGEKRNWKAIGEWARSLVALMR